LRPARQNDRRGCIPNGYFLFPKSGFAKAKAIEYKQELVKPGNAVSSIGGMTALPHSAGKDGQRRERAHVLNKDLSGCGL